MTKKLEQKLRLKLQSMGIDNSELPIISIIGKQDGTITSPSLYKDTVYIRTVYSDWVSLGIARCTVLTPKADMIVWVDYTEEQPEQFQVLKTWKGEDKYHAD